MLAQAENRIFFEEHGQAYVTCPWFKSGLTKLNQLKITLK